MLAVKRFVKYIQSIVKKTGEIVLISALKLNFSKNRRLNLKNINKIAIPLFAEICDAIISPTIL